MDKKPNPNPSDTKPPRIALVWRGDPAVPPPAPETTRHRLMFAELAGHGAIAEPIIYADDIAGAVHQRLLAFDGVLVWVDPISDGKDRSRLDPILRDLSLRGIWVSTHPDVILKMGVKEVLYRTRDLGWGSDTRLYASIAQFEDLFPQCLAKSGPRVLKQNRGNGGIGVWKVELVDPTAQNPGRDSMVRVLHAKGGSEPEELTLGAFMQRCQSYLAGNGRIIDQPFQPRLPEGMIRCYLSQGQVVGFGHQLIKALIPPPPVSAGPEAALPGSRIMHGPDAPAFQAIRRKLEDEWVPGMQRILEIETRALPAIWDADFLHGPKTRNGEDSYVLCEINVSSVAPYPDSAPPRVAETALQCLRASAAS